MGDTANWEFAAVVAAVTIGLGGLLVFTIAAIVASWQLFGRAGRAASEGAKAALAVQDLARYLAAREASHASEPVTKIREAAAALEGLRQDARDLLGQQQQLIEAVRNLVEAGVLRTEAVREAPVDLEASVRRLKETLDRVASAVAALGERPV